jgi:hypothetical protein
MMRSKTFKGGAILLFFLLLVQISFGAINIILEPSNPTSGGNVTSVGVSVPTGLTVNNSPITSSGTIDIGMDVGYIIPLQSTIDGKQATITGGATTITSSNLIANRALASDASGKVAVSTTTATELSYVSGVTSSIQTQLNSKLSSIAGLDHNSLGNLTTGDPHTQYLRLNGRTGGQTVAGGLSGIGNLVLTSNGAGSKTSIVFGSSGNSIYDENQDRWGMYGQGSPNHPLHIGTWASVASSGITDSFIVAGFTDDTIGDGKAEIYTQGEDGGAFSIYQNDGDIASSIYQSVTDTALNLQNFLGGFIFTSGSTVSALLTNTGLSVGTTLQNAKLQSLSTTEQLRLNYDASKYASFTVGSTGNLLIDLSGSGTLKTSYNEPVEVPNDAYSSGWTANNEVPTKNAVRSEIESVKTTIPVYVATTGDSITSTSLVNVNGLSIPLTAGTYIYEVHMTASSSTTAGARFAVAYTGTTTATAGTQIGQTTNTAWAATSNSNTIGAEGTTTSTTANTQNKILLTGTITVSNSGTFTVQARKLTSGTLTIQNGGWLKIVKI